MFTFLLPTPDHAALLLEWRSAERVTRFMKTDVSHDLAGQLEWLARCDARDDYAHWVVHYGARPIGYLSLAFDGGRGSPHWGYYVGEEKMVGLGGLVPPYLYNHVFFDLGCESLVAEVMEGNEPLLKLHRFHGYDYEGFEADVVSKGQHSYGMHRLSLHHNTWAAKTAMHRYRSPFPAR